MDEDIIFQPQKDPSAPSENADPAENEVDTGTERVFDISSDLNISQVKDEEASSGSIKVVRTAPSLTPSSSPIASVEAPGINQLHQPARPIPMQDFTDSLSRARAAGNAGGVTWSTAPPAAPIIPRTAPANPPAKTIGGGAGFVASKPATHAPSVSNLKSIRTFEGDIAEAMAHKHSSTASIAIAESSKTGEGTRIVNRPTSHSTRNFFFFILSIILIAAGVFGAYYLFAKSPLAPDTKPTATAPQIRAALIRADVQTLVPIDAVNKAGLLSRLSTLMAKAQNAGTIRELIPVRIATGNPVAVTAPDMLAILKIPAPDILTRSLGPVWMLGEYATDAGQKSTFIVTTNTFFQNAFAGMLQWENLMPDDLQEYLHPGTPAGTTAPQGQFVDRIISNRDVREFVTRDGQTLFLYSFVDNTKLVIAANEATLREVLSRLEKQSFVR